jgi:hypothetical protein
MCGGRKSSRTAFKSAPRRLPVTAASNVGNAEMPRAGNFAALQKTSTHPMLRNINARRLTVLHKTVA